MSDPFHVPTTLPYAGNITVPLSQAPWTRPSGLNTWNNASLWPAVTVASIPTIFPYATVDWFTEWYTPFSMTHQTSNAGAFAANPNSDPNCQAWPGTLSVAGLVGTVPIPPTNGNYFSYYAGTFFDPTKNTVNAPKLSMQYTTLFPQSSPGIGATNFFPVSLNLGSGLSQLGWANDVFSASGNNPVGAAAYLPFAPKPTVPSYYQWISPTVAPFYFGATFRIGCTIPFGNQTLYQGQFVGLDGNYIGIRKYNVFGNIDFVKGIDFRLDDPGYSSMLFLSSKYSATVAGFIIATGAQPTYPVRSSGGAYYVLIPPSMDRFYGLELIGVSGLAQAAINANGIFNTNVKIDPTGTFTYAPQTYTTVYTSFGSSINITRPSLPPVSLTCTGGCVGVPYMLGVL